MAATSMSISEKESPEPCSCACVPRLTTLEREVLLLKGLGDEVDQFKGLLEALSRRVDELIGCGGLDRRGRDAGSSGLEKPDEKEPAAPPVGGGAREQRDGEEEEGNKRPEYSGGSSVTCTPSSAPIVTVGDEDEQYTQLPLIDDSGGVENVEITPDVFGHFLLDENDEDVRAVAEEKNDDGGVDEEEEAEQVPEGSKRKRRHYDDSDSEDCYTVSDDSDDVSSSDLSSSSDEDYCRRRGRRGAAAKGGAAMSSSSARFAGKAAKRSCPITASSSSSNAPFNNNVESMNMPSSSAATTKLDLDTRMELMKQCRRRPGDIWECTVCGFMLSSLENMLLHVKYNHSMSTHTCPFCKVVVLCRSPKDAMMHQIQCKMRPQGSKCRAPKYTVTPPPPPTTTRQSVQDIDDKVNKFVDELLDPTKAASKLTTTTSTTNNNNNIKKKRTQKPAVIVTLSSDEDGDS